MKTCLIPVSVLMASFAPVRVASAVTFDWVTVGDPGNACDNEPLQGCFGAVNYVYRIAKYEVTNAQYAEFLNAKAASDPLELYNTNMGAGPGGIARSGSPGSYTYSATPGRENKPVMFVSYFDVLRFANWLHNGQGSGDTETGAYTLLGGTPTPSDTFVERNPGATIFVPTEDEWYKAAYYNPSTGTYFHYPTESDTQVVCSAPSATPNCANCASAAGEFTDVGSYPGSPSPYGTFDQGGNVEEWSDAIVFLDHRPLRAGAAYTPADRLQKSVRNYDDPAYEAYGVRMASLADAPVCGDGNCEGGESTLNCNQDCPCATNSDCDDGVFCNGFETCSNGMCVPGVPVNCDDGVPCTLDYCYEATQACVHSPVNSACDNGLFCDGAETCHPTLGCQAGVAPCNGAPCNESTETCLSTGPVVWMSFKANTLVPGVGTVADEDIVAYDMNTGGWSLKFDGSDVGLSGHQVDGLALLTGGDLLLSLAADGSVAGLIGGPSGNTVDESDIVRFTPTSLGSTTAGTFTFYFDGSDVGLTSSNEDIDGIALSQNGSLILSTVGSFSASGASGAGEDLILFAATSLGASTAGSFTLHFDGNDVGLSSSSENIDAVTRTSAGDFLLSTTGSFSVPGVSGANEDMLKFTPTRLGSSTAGSYAMYLDLSTLGISADDVGALHFAE